VRGFILQTPKRSRVKDKKWEAENLYYLFEKGSIKNHLKAFDNSSTRRLSGAHE
jgi:hypothetical protein